jgi:flavin reductase (DIM6/NTAB) family NADH-FMN oxidoreductase RutF
MRKDFGARTWFYPLPVLIIASYDKKGNANAMNAAWGGIYDSNRVVLSLSADHKTTENIRARKAFTISFGDAAHVAACDYVGLVSGNDVPDKLKKAGFTTHKSRFVDAPVICELPMALECRLIKINEDGNIIGEIVNVSADESVLGEDGLIDVAKLRPISFDPVHNYYLVLGEKVGNAFQDGNALK